MKSVTIKQVIAWRPCGLYDDDDGTNYTPQRIQCLFAGRESLTAQDIALLNIPADDRVWALLHNEFLTDEQMHLLACDFANAVMHLCNDDPRPCAAIEAKRAWLRGDVDDNELASARAAARDAARAAAWDAAWAAAWASARAAAWAAARDAAWAAAWAAARAAARDAARAAARDAAWDAQIKMILKAIGA